MRKYLIHMIAGIFMLAVFLPMQVSAESGELKLDGNGMVTFVSKEAAGEGSTSLAFSLSVEAAEGSTVEFQFGENNAKVAEFRYHEAEGKLNIYMAGTEALIPEESGSLTVGRVVVLDGGGNSAAATVGVVPGSVQYVSGAELKSPEDLKLPEAVQMGAATGGKPGDDNSGGNDSAGHDEDDKDDEDEEDTPIASQPGNNGQGSSSGKPGSGGTGSSGRPGSGTGSGTVKPGSNKPGSGGNGSSSNGGSTGESGGPSKPESSAGKEDSPSSEGITGSDTPDRTPEETVPVIGGDVRKEDSAGAGRMTWIYVVAAVAALLALAVVALAVIEVRKHRRDSL